MTTPNLGRLTTVPPRDVWTYEAHDFTPWLLQNVDILSDLLGMDLALDVAEQRVGDFSLDLIGHDLSHDSRVIVENQLEQSDHTHLGQILTYAAGTNPKTIVWITTGFRPEQRAASIRVHGRGPLSDLLVEALRCWGPELRTAANRMPR
jgi:hypothetical protein